MKTGSAVRWIIIPMGMLSLIMIGWYAHGNQSSWTEEHEHGHNEIVSKVIWDGEEGYIQEKLAEAEAIWKRGIEAREVAEIQSPIPRDTPWAVVDYRCIWDFFYPNFNCPHSVERLGRLGDGGKWVCGVSHLAKHKTECILFSYGISGDSSFEEDILKRTNCVVHAYDHTIEADTVAISKLFPNRTTFTKLGLGNEDKGQLRTLKSEMIRHGTSFIDILKIDAEGAEAYAIPQILQDFPGKLPFGQLLIELHLDYFPDNKHDLYNILKKWWEPLEKAGLRPYRAEPNLIASLIGAKYPSYYEMSFLNIKTDNVMLHA